MSKLTPLVVLGIVLIALGGYATIYFVPRTLPVDAIMHVGENASMPSYKQVTCDITVVNNVFYDAGVSDFACNTLPQTGCLAGLTTILQGIPSQLGVISDGIQVSVSAGRAHKSTTIKVYEGTDEQVRIVLDCVPITEKEADVSVQDGSVLLFTDSTSI